MLRSTALIEGLVYVSQTKSILSARARSFVYILFASSPNVFLACSYKQRKNIAYTTYVSLISGLPLVTFSSNLCMILFFLSVLCNVSLTSDKERRTGVKCYRWRWRSKFSMTAKYNNLPKRSRFSCSSLILHCYLNFNCVCSKALHFTFLYWLFKPSWIIKAFISEPLTHFFSLHDFIEITVIYCNAS